MNERPDEEGIETAPSGTTIRRPATTRMNERPDEEGIETVKPGIPAMRRINRMNERPDEEGIETYFIHRLQVDRCQVRMNERPDEEGIETHPRAAFP